MAVKYELNTAFRWYLSNGAYSEAASALAKQHRNCCPEGLSDSFKLYTQPHTMLPFQFLIRVSQQTITPKTFNLVLWRIVKSTVEDPLSNTLNAGDYFDVLAELTTAGYPLTNYFSKTAVPDKGIYITGCHLSQIGQYPGNAFPFVIPSGSWYSVMKFEDGLVAVSEVFYVPCKIGDVDKYFNSGGPLTRFDWKNSKDVFDILYQNGFVNRLWLESDLVDNKPTIVEEGIETQDGAFVQQSIKFIDNYQLKEHVPEYIYRACLAIRSHDNLTLWVRGYTYYSFPVLRNCEIDWDDSGVEGVMTLSFQQVDTTLSKFGCPANMPIGSPLPLQAKDDTIKVFPRAGLIPGFKVTDNDIGLGLSTVLNINVNVGAGALTVNINADGSIRILAASGTYGSFTTPVTITDYFGNNATSVLTFVVSDWVPTLDRQFISHIDILNGIRVFDFGTYSLLSNDSYPINVNTVTCLAGTYYSLVSGTGNYITVDAAGHVIYNITNPVSYDYFLVTYYNSTTATFKQQYLYIYMN